MDLKSLTDSMKNGTGIKNPLDSVSGSLTSSLSSLAGSSIPGMADLLTSVQNASKAANDAVKGITDSLMTKLPLLKAADNISSKLGAIGGSLPPVGGGDAFKKAFGPLTDAQNHLASIQSSLTPDMMTKLQSGDSSAMASLSGLASSATSGISSSVSASTAGIQDSVSNLKSFAFAKFSTMPQPPHVQEILDKVGVPKIPYEKVSIDTQSAQALVPPVPKERLPALPKVVPSEPTSIFSGPSKERIDKMNTAVANLNAIGYAGSTYIEAVSPFKEAYGNYLQSRSDAADAALKDYNTRAAAVQAWKDANLPDYDKIKAESAANPSDAALAATYQSNKNRLLTESGYSELAPYRKTYDDLRADVLRLRDQLTKWVINDYDGVKAGPPW